LTAPRSGSGGETVAKKEEAARGANPNGHHQEHTARDSITLRDLLGTDAAHAVDLILTQNPPHCRYRRDVSLAIDWLTIRAEGYRHGLA